MKKSPLFSIFLIMLVDVLGFTIILPLLPFYAEKFGASPFVVGLLLSTYGLCQLIAGPILGHVSDRIGRKPLLLVSQFGTLIGFIILALSNSLPLIFVSRIIDGLTAGNFSVAQAYISDVTEPKNRTKAFGVVGIAFGLGFLLGPAIAGFLARFGYHYPIFAAATLSATSIAATAFLLPSSPPHTAHQHEAEDERGKSEKDGLHYLSSFKDPGLAPFLWQFFSFIFAFVIFMSGFALFAERRFVYHGVPFGAKEVGYVFAYAGLIGVVIQAGFIGKLVHIFGEVHLVKIGYISMFLGFVLLGWVHTIPFLLIAVAILFFGSSVLRPSLMSLITQNTKRSQQGMAVGLTQSLMSVAQITAPMLSGILIQHLFLSLWAWVGALVSGAGLFLIQQRISTYDKSPNCAQDVQTVVPKRGFSK